MISENVKKYCYEDPSLIENYELAIADNTQIWDIHHRVETIMNCSAEELIAKGCYDNRPAHDLIFLTKSEHNKLHKVGNKNFLGHKHSDKTRAKMRESIKETLSRPEVRAKISAAVSGENHPMYGKKHSAKTRAKISASNYGKHWFNNGIECRFCKESPGPDWTRGRI